VIFLALVFMLYGCPKFRVGMGDGVFTGEHGALPKDNENWKGANSIMSRIKARFDG
jgi:hypothetical protein